MSFAKNTHAIETFPRRVGSDDTMVGVNMQLEARAPVEKLEWVNSLRIALPHLDSDAEDENAGPRVATARIDLSQGFLGDDGPDDDAPRLVGSISTSRSAEWFIYSESPCAEQLERAITTQFPQLEIHAHAKHDPEWSVFREFLMPSPLERHLIETRRTFEGLATRGFKTNDRVTINHTVWFNAREDRQDFADGLPDGEYFAHFPELDEDEIEAFQIPNFPAPDADVDVEYGVLVEHHERFKLEDFDEGVRFIFRRAATCGGEYEGWYTPDDRGN